MNDTSLFECPVHYIPVFNELSVSTPNGPIQSGSCFRCNGSPVISHLGNIRAKIERRHGDMDNPLKPKKPRSTRRGNSTNQTGVPPVYPVSTPTTPDPARRLARPCQQAAQVAWYSELAPMTEDDQETGQRRKRVFGCQPLLLCRSMSRRAAAPYKELGCSRFGWILNA